MIITFDGLAATGKSTLANRLAKELNYEYLDSGIFFRSMALFFIDHNFHLEDICTNTAILDLFKIEFTKDNIVLLNGCDVTKRIREVDVTNLSTELSKYEMIKQNLYDKIRNYCKNKDIVVDGRCLATKILPFADVKFFITCPLEERASRRAKQFKNVTLSKAETIKQFSQLDKIEAEKGALECSADLYTIQNYEKTEDEVFDEILQIVRNVVNNKNKRRLRLLVTHNCNYNCKFCHNEGIDEIKKELLNVEDYVFLCQVIKNRHNIDHINISGGEPLLRRDIVEIIKRLKALGFNMALTTNGFLLDLTKDVGKYLDSINISFHANQKKYYEEITGTKNTFEKVKNNIKLIKNKYPHLKIFLNVGYTKEVFSDYSNIISLVNLAIKTGAILKFIEIFPKTNESYINIDILKKLLNNLEYSLCYESIRSICYVKDKSKIILERCFCSEAYYKDIPQEFCQKNNDLFLTSEGSVTLCRNSSAEICLLSEIRERSEEVLSKKIDFVISKLAEPCCCKSINEG